MEKITARRLLELLKGLKEEELDLPVAIHTYLNDELGGEGVHSEDLVGVGVEDLGDSGKNIAIVANEGYYL